MGRGTWWATVHGATKSWIQLSTYTQIISELECLFMYLLAICMSSSEKWASLVSQLVKNLPAMQETPIQFLGWEDLLVKG